MDGLTVSNLRTILKTGETTSQIRNDKINAEAVGNPNEYVKSFSQTLKDAVNNVNDLQVKSNVEMEKLATGQTKNISEVMIASEKASIAFKLLMQVRNKVIAAYQDVMRMQV